MNPKYAFFEKFKKIKKCIRLVKKKTILAMIRIKLQIKKNFKYKKTPLMTLY